jgi:hypothetical protein
MRIWLPDVVTDTEKTLLEFYIFVGDFVCL